MKNYMVRKFTKSLVLIALTGLSSLVQAQFTWSPAGPIYTAGRARNMIVDKNDATGQTMYVGSTSSGIFKTTDGGANWNPLDDQGTVRNISYMAQGTDGTIWVGTGEGFLRTGQKSKALPGTGLYKLNGNSLTLVIGAGTIGNVVNRIAASPASANNIAITTNNGIWTSTDGGSSFNNVSASFPNVPTATNVVGQDVDFDNNGILYCSIGPVVGTSTVVPGGGSKVYKSTDASISTFTDKTPSTTVTDQLYGRIEIAIAPSNNNVVYVSCANKNSTGSAPGVSTLKALFVTYDAGSNWGFIIQGSPQLDPLSNGGTLASGDYAHMIQVHPTDQHMLFVGGYFLYSFKRNVGSSGDSDANPIGTWTQYGIPYAPNTQVYLHENIHDLKIVNGNPTRYYVITDAGIYRSLDLLNVLPPLPPSFATFQPFYKGLVTGQFNSVSIERYPIGANSTSTVSGAKVDPYSGFVGGTGGNGMTYYSGTFNNVTQESNYLFGDVYNAEFSKILPNAAFTSIGNGNLYRTSNVKNTAPGTVKWNKYSGVLSKIAGETEDFSNINITTGTPFKLWESYGQNAFNPDSIFFYNDSVRFQASVGSVAELTVATNFAFVCPRPNKYALIDSIVIRSGTVTIPVSGTGANAPTFNTGTGFTIKLPDTYANTGSVTAFSGTGFKQLTGVYSTVSQPTVILNNTSLSDVINVTYASPPFATKTQTSATVNHATYYRVFATVFYKYSAGDEVVVTDNNISTKINNYAIKLPKDLNWRYGSTAPVVTVSATPSSIVSNNSYVFNPTIPGVPSPTTVNSVTTNVVGVRIYTVSQYGTYSLTAKPVSYVIDAPVNMTVPGSTYSFVLMPGGVIKTAAATSTTAVSFTVSPAITTNYTVTQSGTGTLTSDTYSTVTTSYSLAPSNVTQNTPMFTVVISPTNAAQVYTVTGINTDPNAVSTTTTINTPVTSTISVGSSQVPFATQKSNPIIKVQKFESARLALSLTANAITGGNDAVVVAKNPLALNDPLSFVRVSQSGCLTDDASGAPSTSLTTSVLGRPTIIEWSKTGTELYYATDQNKLYRVSHIFAINDLSPSSYNGKFFTDIFKYNNSSPHTPNAATLNPESPYRTTLIGSFDLPITSISVARNDAAIAVTFSNSSSTATTGLVMLSQGDIKKQPTWVNKGGGLTGVTTYCSLMEKDDYKKVFVGTDNGIWYTSDITSVSFSKANNNQLPNVQIFDIEQQVMEPWDCYNSGQIYVATNGRGVWTNNEYIKSYFVGVNENGEIKAADESHLSLYPNPANGLVNVAFKGVDGEDATLQIMDLSGRNVRTEHLGTQPSDDVIYSFDSQNMNAGVYIVNVSSNSGVKRVAKLIVTK
jgi:hypothetical protein